VASATDLRALKLPESKHLIIHARAAGRHGKDPRVLLLGTGPDAVYSFDLAKLPLGPVAELLASRLSAGVKLVGYDIKSSLKVLLELGVQLPEAQIVEHDVLIGAFLLNSLRREQSLTELAEAICIMMDLRWKT